MSLSEPPMVVSSKICEDKMTLNWDHVSVRSSYVKKLLLCQVYARNTIIISIITLHWSWKSHNYKITSKTVTLLCRGKKQFGKPRSTDTLCAMCVCPSSFAEWASKTTARETSVTRCPGLLGRAPCAICSAIQQKTTKVWTHSFHAASFV